MYFCLIEEKLTQKVASNSLILVIKQNRIVLLQKKE